MTSAFLLTRQWQDAADGVRLDLWFATAKGPMPVSIGRQRAVFFVRQDDMAAVETALASMPGVSLRALQLKTFDAAAAAAVYFQSQQSLYRARDQLAQLGIACYESDIRPVERFLSERFITAAVDIDTDYCASGVRDVVLKPGEYRPALVLMSVDIESDFETDQLYSIGFVAAGVGRVLMIGDGIDDEVVEYLADERALIRRWLHWVRELDPDVLIGWNLVNFDLRMLDQRARALGIPFRLGRGGGIPTWRRSQADGNQHFIAIAGRVALDGIDTLRAATYVFASFALESVAREMLGRGKLIHQQRPADPLYKAREIRRQFNHDKPSLARYNLEDCQLVWDIFEHAGLVDFAIERAQLTGLELNRIGGSVAAFDNLYLPRLHRKGYVAPNIGDYRGELNAPGGYVMDSKPGLYRSVLLLDYKSLYPSIIRSFHVDPYARIAAQGADPEDCIPGYDGASFHKREYILPDIIESLWAARDLARRDGNAALSQAIKIIMNSFYGVLGTPGCRLHDSRLTSSITRRGHDIILQTVSLIAEAGYEVIYGDTDSVFVSLAGAHDSVAATSIARRLVDRINSHWRQSLAREYAIESFLEMEFETHFAQFFMPTMRGSEQGSKKRYAGLVEDEDGGRRIVFKGLEAVRTDWTAMAREFQQRLYQLIFDGAEYREYILQTVERLYAGELDDQLVYRKRLRKRLQEYRKNIPPHAQAAIRAEANFRANGEPSRYRNKSWIEYVVTVAGAQTLECRSDRLDYDHYLEKQLSPIVDTILGATGSSMAAVLDQQQALF